MGLFSRLFHEFVDVIEWIDSTNDTMVYRFERYGNEIKYGAKLIVRETQFAVFVNEGEVALTSWKLKTFPYSLPCRIGITGLKARSKQRCTFATQKGLPI